MGRDTRQVLPDPGQGEAGNEGFLAGGTAG
jgi:hypothetical protein